MALVLQCQACSKTTDAPSTWNYYKGPWRCPFCQAQHIINCSLGHLDTMQLDDRFAPGHVACSDSVASDVREAIASFNAYAPRAAVVMIRRALERACDETGAREGKLWEKIKDLHKRVGCFDDAHVALATATRHFGNVGAH